MISGVAAASGVLVASSVGASVGASVAVRGSKGALASTFAGAFLRSTTISTATISSSAATISTLHHRPFRFALGFVSFFIPVPHNPFVIEYPHHTTPSRIRQGARAQVLQTCHKAANPSRCQQALLPVLLEAERISPRRPMATKPTISAISQPTGIASQIAIMPKCGAKA